MREGADGVRVAFKTFGCKVNRVESEEIAADLLGRGVALCDEGTAEVVVVNTCTVTGEADSKARKAIRHVLALPGSPVVVVTGCLAALDAASLAEMADRVVVVSDKETVAEAVAGLFGLGHSSGVAGPPSGEGFRTRAMLKIEDGCDAFCSYCIVPHARGGPRSERIDDVVAKASRLVEAGAREIVLTGINLGRYRDDAAGSDLARLVSAVADTGVWRLRLSSIEPRDLTERFLEVAARTPAFCPHLHVPLQSGSDSVLAAMSREYTAREYVSLLRAAADAIPGLAVTTDVIAGFPGETENDAAETLALCEEVGFRRMHVFRYSARSGTPAAERRDQVAPGTRAARATALRDRSSWLWVRSASAVLGEERELLVERIEGSDAGGLVAEGTTPDYLRVRVELPSGAAASCRVGELLGVRLVSAAGERVEAVPVEPVLGRPVDAGAGFARTRA